MKMYRVCYGERSWWTSVPMVEEREVVKKTAKTVLYKEDVKSYVDGKYQVTGTKQCREHLVSVGVKWFDDFESAKAFAIEDQENKLRVSEERTVKLRENLEEMRRLECPSQ